LLESISIRLSTRIIVSLTLRIASNKINHDDGNHVSVIKKSGIDCNIYKIVSGLRRFGNKLFSIIKNSE